MGKIPKTSERYRTKEQMVGDLVIALNSDMTYAGKYSVLKAVCWQWTTFSGKYKGCEWWTKEAAKLFDRDPKTKLLRHEHAVPKSIVIEMLLDLKSPTIAEEVREICERCLVGVVVTKKEDSILNKQFRKSMPAEFDRSTPKDNDRWLRYEWCGLKVVQRCWD
jgi:hypothetical protein